MKGHSLTIMKFAKVVYCRLRETTWDSRTSNKIFLFVCYLLCLILYTKLMIDATPMPRQQFQKSIFYCKIRNVTGNLQNCSHNSNFYDCNFQHFAVTFRILTAKCGKLQSYFEMRLQNVTVTLSKLQSRNCYFQNMTAKIRNVTAKFRNMMVNF